MVLRSKTILSGSKGLVHSRSSDNLPTVRNLFISIAKKRPSELIIVSLFHLQSQSQVNIQMISHTLSIREVSMRSRFID